MEQCIVQKSLSHVWLSNPMDCSLPGSSIHGILQARVLEWGATAFSEQRLSILPKLILCLCMLSHVQLFVTSWSIACQAPLSMDRARQEYWSGFHSLLQGIFPTQGWSQPLCVSCIGRWVLYQFSHGGSQLILGFMHFPKKSFPLRLFVDRDYSNIYIERQTN